jgi:hypothetical protein
MMNSHPSSKPKLTMLLGAMVLNIAGLMILGALAFLFNSPSIEIGYARGKAIGEIMGPITIGVLIATVTAVYFWQQDPAENKRQAMVAVIAGAIYLLVVGTYVISLFFWELKAARSLLESLLRSPRYSPAPITSLVEASWVCRNAPSMGAGANECAFWSTIALPL